MLCCILLAGNNIEHYKGDQTPNTTLLERAFRFLAIIFSDDNWALRRFLRVQRTADFLQQPTLANYCSCNARIDLIKRIVVKQTDHIETCVSIVWSLLGSSEPPLTPQIIKMHILHARREIVEASERIDSHFFKMNQNGRGELGPVLDTAVHCLNYPFSIFLGCTIDCCVGHMCQTNPSACSIF